MAAARPLDLDLRQGDPQVIFSPTGPNWTACTSSNLFDANLAVNWADPERIAAQDARGLEAERRRATVFGVLIGHRHATLLVLVVKIILIVGPATGADRGGRHHRRSGHAV